MYPAFLGPGRQRKINLGGSTTTKTQEAVLDTVRAQREQRLDQRRRAESAHKIQAWWRGTSEARRVKSQLKARFDAQNDPPVIWTRLLVVAGLLGPFSTPDAGSWLVLTRQVSVLILKDVAATPKSPQARNHLQVLSALVSPTCPAAIRIMGYLLDKGLYPYISTAIRALDDKSAPALPLLCSLITAPFSIFDSGSEKYSGALFSVFQHILTIPRLPNRLPLASLTQFAGQLPWASLGNIPVSLLVQVTDLEAKAHLLANMVVFIPPRMQALPAPAVSTYLEASASVLASLPPDGLEPVSKASAVTSWNIKEDSDDSDSEQHVQKAPAPPPPRLKLDGKTLTRLQTVVSPGHIASLMAKTSNNPGLRVQVFRFFLSLSSAWPAKRDQVFSSIVFSPNGSTLIKEVWRGWVRRASLGKRSRTGIEALRDPSNQDLWPPLLFLVDTYTHSLRTMTDDEFFSTGGARSSAVRSQPLLLDEVAEFSKQILNIVFPLYWNEDQMNVREDSIPGLPSMKWETARDKLTRCLKAIHARDSRRKFTPEDHWLMTSEIDMQSFCEAAIFEERNLDRTTDRTLSKRQMAYISPRLGVLNNIPFAIPFNVRVEIFRDFVANDMARVDAPGPEGGAVGYHCTIRRSHISKDGYDTLNGLGHKLKRRIRITFIDQFGNEESGIDGGGVFKEFLTSLSKEAFDTDRGLWLATKQQALYPNPHSYARESHQLSWYRFIGRILGKALYEGILVDVSFATFFLAKWLGKQSYLDDLASLDHELYQGLLFLKHYDGNVEDLSLNFTVTDNEFGETKTINLLPNGVNIPVTKENRMQYIYMVSNYRLNVQMKQQSEAFFEGLSDVIDPKWLRMFNQQELQILIGGTEEPVNVDDLLGNTVYGGSFNEDHPTVKAFWKVLKSFDQAQRCAFLRFVTSCARPPLLGFKELNPKFSIRDAGSDNSRLPTASTCVNLLKLPLYSNEYILRQKLLQAINAGAGFDLS
ncbi:hypothetical protein M407DRAFT_14471 [Tulasnella calospora MUT 4182]|uniref:HECT-type E3 ubiquitin transferase n=1 Tax=Tulasnella calospora MUT 4182 TaxID=1051891 RepID=A0A0C3QER4_9AGAM|nr:hypothetical protein M407DRAFT_14471 [Tulasnella calospora MUT 4182]